MSLIQPIKPGSKLRAALCLSLLLLALNALSIEHGYNSHIDHQEHHCPLFTKGTHSLPVSLFQEASVVVSHSRLINIDNSVCHSKPECISARSPPLLT
ncbi:DUF2607 family protein [Vibrio barjaei]|uniref:DUF2607 family protein n=1 Tax=Vibrio barjaei TaxID=1676683 RepID=UPI0022838755|nr:DUF2607 family protein [Vibrio barjaei]MCY9873126.1 DUF2607 family protein [Vibrio barjaei]